MSPTKTLFVALLMGAATAQAADFHWLSYGRGQMIDLAHLKRDGDTVDTYIMSAPDKAEREAGMNYDQILYHKVYNCRDMTVKTITADAWQKGSADALSLKTKSGFRPIPEVEDPSAKKMMMICLQGMLR